MTSHPEHGDLICRVIYHPSGIRPLGALTDMFEAVCYLIAAAVRRNPIGCPRYSPEHRSRPLNLFGWETARACPVLAISYPRPSELVLGVPVPYSQAGAAALLALPALVAGVSGLANNLSGGPPDQYLIDGYRTALAAIGPQDFKPRRPGARPTRSIDLREQRELGALALIQRVITTHGLTVVDSASPATQTDPARKEPATDAQLTNVELTDERREQVAQQQMLDSRESDVAAARYVIPFNDDRLPAEQG
ncbi:MAG: hypothetical protein H0T91_07535 [Propionibacteriaceae bacterium]|nr:hypothetical protein [Propionibacteriaceae bacterium]